MPVGILRFAYPNLAPVCFIYGYIFMLKLNNRLIALAECVRGGAVLYDVGTDHAYLPVQLVGSGKTERAVASDISSEPLRHAERIIAENGLSDRIETLLSNGLENITLQYPCDVVIAGMGGDTIISIIEAKKELRDERVHLVLQPMTKQYEVRRYLLENGFDIYRETLADDGRIFQIICACYTGDDHHMDDFELFLGRGIEERCKSKENSNDKPNDKAVVLKFLNNRYETLKTRLDGKAAAGLDISFEKKICEKITELLK